MSLYSTKQITYSIGLAPANTFYSNFLFQVDIILVEDYSYGGIVYDVYGDRNIQVEMSMYRLQVRKFFNLLSPWLYSTETYLDMNQ